MSVFLLRYRGIPSGSLGFQRNHFVTPCGSHSTREDIADAISSLFVYIRAYAYIASIRSKLKFSFFFRTLVLLIYYSVFVYVSYILI